MGEIAIPVETAEVVCDETEASCRCVLSPHDGGPHRCACGGSWEWVDGKFVTHALPGSDGDWDDTDYAAIANAIFGL